MTHICINALKKCYAGVWSYGEICVRCNCCGQFDRKKMWHARRRFHREELKRNREFDRWSNSPSLRKTQEKNVKANIIHHRKKIKQITTRLATKK